MKPGSIIRDPSGSLAVVGYYKPENLPKGGVRLTTPYGVTSCYTELAEVTDFTPKLCKELSALLPLAIWHVDKGMGMTGTDPEIFAFTKDGAVIPAWLWAARKEEGTGVFWDGVQAEFDTTPTSCHNYQTDRIHAKLKQTQALLHAYDPNAVLACEDVVKLDAKTLLLADDEHINLGCSPSQNAYPGVEPIAIPDPRSHAIRYSGCHIHQSILDHPMPSWFPNGTVTMIDKVAGVFLTALGRDMENPLRREAYGRAGEYRVPPPSLYPEGGSPSWVGKFYTRLEYRTPGSFLLRHPALFNFAADVVRVAFRMGLIMDGRLLPDIGDVQGIINTCDADAAVKLITAKGSFYRKVLDHMPTGYQCNSRTMAILTSGAKASGLFEGSVAANWKLDATEGWNNDNYNNGFTSWSRIPILGA